MPLVVGMSAAVIAMRKVCPKLGALAPRLSKNTMTTPRTVLLVIGHLAFPALAGEENRSLMRVGATSMPRTLRIGVGRGRSGFSGCLRHTTPSFTSETPYRGGRPELSPGRTAWAGALRPVSAH